MLKYLIDSLEKQQEKKQQAILEGNESARLIAEGVIAEIGSIVRQAVAENEYVKAYSQLKQDNDSKQATINQYYEEIAVKETEINSNKSTMSQYETVDEVRAYKLTF